MSDKKARLSLPPQTNVGKIPLRHTQSQIRKKSAPRVPPIILEESTDSSEVVLKVTKETKRRESSASKSKIEGASDERRISKPKLELKPAFEEGRLSRTKSGSKASHAYDNEAFEGGSSSHIFSRGHSERSSMNPSVTTVHQEKYCICSKWSTCQRAAAVTISILVIIVVVLIVVIIVMANKTPEALKSLKNFRLSD